MACRRTARGIWSRLVAPELLSLVVARLHASAPGGHVVHIHDPAAWWPGHEQPISCERAMALDDDRALARLRGPQAWDPRAVLRARSIPIVATGTWRWPFAPGVDYLVQATVAGGHTGTPCAGIRASGRHHAAQHLSHPAQDSI